MGLVGRAWIDLLTAMGYIHPAIADVIEEYYAACQEHPPMHSAHEGWAVIKEELDELWEEVRKKNPSRELQYKEAKQVAATAIRFMIDVCQQGP